MNLGLQRIEQLLDRLGNPQRKLKIIHVAGTNGKGSTCAMIAAILQAAGYRVGLYTSPHLFKYNERIKINGQDISDKDFSQGLTGIGREEQGLAGKLTAFEALTALAFWYFAKKKVDYAVVEVGLGGRLDATNVVTPLISVITNIDLEHTSILGRTLARIALEKAAIIKPGVPVVTAEAKPEALQVIKHQAEKKGSMLIQVGSQGEGLPSALVGDHQKINAACAVVAVRLADIKVDKETILRGLTKVKWPARFQIVKKEPLTIVDGAHNPAGARVLAAALRLKYPGRKFVFIFGTQTDKAADQMLDILRPLAKKIIVTHSSHQNAAEKKSLPLVRALTLAAREDRVITGSLFLAADALKLLDRRRRA
ncbi:MAG: bifunctional folylpolyglutamate synthase/dihydrofolate synthase [Candidatus Margulisbacteria bacterium]|nr:bifunctional folylpolyglutamate synthase/dihydrofolate synthase [Candidatus Margulisiibacteriota bacterium]